MKNYIILCLLSVTGCSFSEKFISGMEVREPIGAAFMNHRKNCDTVGCKEELSYIQLAKIQYEAHKRFKYKKDTGIIDHWPLFSEIPNTGIFKDDCDGFTQMVRKEINKLGGKSVIQLVAIDSVFSNHTVCRYNGWLIDNTHRGPIRRADVPGWTFTIHSNDAVTKWYKTQTKEIEK